MTGAFPAAAAKGAHRRVIFVSLYNHHRQPGACCRGSLSAGRPGQTAARNCGSAYHQDRLKEYSAAIQQQAFEGEDKPMKVHSLFSRVASATCRGSRAPAIPLPDGRRTAYQSGYSALDPNGGQPSYPAVASRWPHAGHPRLSPTLHEKPGQARQAGRQVAHAMAHGLPGDAGTMPRSDGVADTGASAAWALKS